MKTIIYSRVSTLEQKEGYSLRQQEEALGEWCKKNGYDVLEVIQDTDSGSHIHRPGLDRIKDLVDGGGIDLVVAQDLDRFAREDIYVALLKKEFDRKGTKLYALNQRSDGSAEGDLSDTILGAVAAYERQMIARRTTRGKIQKAKEGKVPCVASYGFDNVDGHFVVNEHMRIVHFVFHAIANHESMYSVENRLADRGIKAPRGGRFYGASLRKYILNDVYKPHTFEELAAIVSTAVIDKLDPNERYGVLWYNTKHIEYEKTSDYRMKQVKKVYKPKEEWIAIPVTDSGIPREIVEKARANLQHQSWKTAKKNGRFFELSGGVGKCGECGRNMSTTARNYKSKTAERPYYYYVCKNRECPHLNKYHKATDLEDKAMEVLQDLCLDGSMIKQRVMEHFDEEKKRIRNPHRNIQDATADIAKLEAKRERLLDLYVEGEISKENWETRTDTINTQISKAQGQIDKLSHKFKSLEEIELRKRSLMELFEFGYRYRLGLTDPVPEYDDEGDRIVEDWKDTGAPTRNRVYKDIGLKVQVSRDDIWVEMGGSTFCPHESFSSRTHTCGSSRPAS